MELTTQSAAETLLAQLLFMKGQRPGTKAKLRDIFVRKLIRSAQQCLIADTGFLRLEPPLILVGGIFAHFYDLLALFETHGYPPTQKYVFLGDIVGRGKENVETLTFLLCHKILFPNHIYIIRGYHELDFVNATDGFRREILKRYDEKMYQLCNDLFSLLPIAAVIAGKIFCVNSGIAPELTHMVQIERSNMTEIKKNDQLFYLLYARPDHLLDVWSEEHEAPPPRFGLIPVKEFLEANDLDLIVRSHDIVDEGYEFPLGGHPSLLTLSTVPTYVEKSERWGSVVEVDLTLKMSFRPVRPLPVTYRDYYQKKKPKPMQHLRTRPVN
jgi:serine/threonine-protein phosphatase PP1 catalytic subunit